MDSALQPCANTNYCIYWW